MSGALANNFHWPWRLTLRITESPMTSVFTPKKDLRGRLLSAFASDAADSLALTELVLAIASTLQDRRAGLFSILYLSSLCSLPFPPLTDRYVSLTELSYL